MHSVNETLLNLSQLHISTNYQKIFSLCCLRQKCCRQLIIIDRPCYTTISLVWHSDRRMRICQAQQVDQPQASLANGPEMRCAGRPRVSRLCQPRCPLDVRHRCDRIASGILDKHDERACANRLKLPGQLLVRYNRCGSRRCEM